ncbi:MAG: hypothetical protein ACLFV7_12175 [Phycisphaerae bacterium]
MRPASFPFWTALLLLSVVSGVRAADDAWPGGSEVYRATFSGRKGRPEWSHRPVRKDPVRNLWVLGPFHHEAVSLSLDKLPKHKYLRVKMRLHLLGAWGSGFGSDRWQLRVAGGPVLLNSDFSNFLPPEAPDVPDELAKAVRTFGQGFPSSFSVVRFAPGTGRAGRNLLGDPNADGGSTTYDLSFVFPHEGGSLRLEMEGPGGAASWALQSVVVEAFESSADPSEKMLAAAWKQLGSDDSATAMQAMGRFVLAGQKGSGFLKARLAPTPDAAKLQELVGQLSAADFRKREAATRALIAKGPAIRAPLAESLDAAEDEEARARLLEVLAKLEAAALPDAQRLLHARAIELLNWYGPDRSLDLLHHLCQAGNYHETLHLARQAYVRAARRRGLAAIDRAADRLARGDLDGARKTLLDAQKRYLRFDGGSRRWGLVAEQISHETARVLGLVDMIARLKQKQQSGKPLPRRMLSEMAMVWLGSPDAAASFLDDSDPAWRRQVSLAADAVAGKALTHDQQAQLGKWYLELAGKNNTPLGRLRLLRKSARLTGAALDSADIDAPRRRELQQQYRTARAQVSQLRSDGGGWVDLLAMLADDADGRNWKLIKSRLHIGVGDFVTVTFPMEPRGSYVLEVDFTRNGDDGIYIAVPAGESAGNLNLGGWGGTIDGLEWIGGRQANNNPTTVKPSGLTPGRHRLTVRTILSEGKASVLVTLDGKKHIEWEGDPSQLHPSGAWKLGRQGAFAVGSHSGKATFHGVRVKPLDDGRSAGP